MTTFFPWGILRYTLISVIASKCDIIDPPLKICLQYCYSILYKNVTVILLIFGRIDSYSAVVAHGLVANQMSII